MRRLTEYLREEDIYFVVKSCYGNMQIIIYDKHGDVVLSELTNQVGTRLKYRTDDEVIRDIEEHIELYPEKWVKVSIVGRIKRRIKSWIE